MFVHTINPVAFSIGNISVYYYGLVYALAFILTYWYLYVQVKHKKFRISTDQLDSLFIYLMIGVVVGGRLGEFIFWRPDLLISNPLSIFYIWQGGMAFHGAIIGVAVGLWLFCKKNNVHFYDITDRIVIPASIALAFGRVANFINAELPGTITRAWVGVNFANETNSLGERIFRHPVQLYLALKNAAVAGLLALDSNKKRGYLTWMFVGLYGLGRFIIDFWRFENKWLLGLSSGQVLSLAMVVIAVIFLYKDHWKKP